MVTTGEGQYHVVAHEGAPCAGYTPRGSVSERERRHFAVIAEAKRQGRGERIGEAIAGPAVKRIIEGLELGEAMPTSPEREGLLDARALGQAELQQRARRLGLRR